MRAIMLAAGVGNRLGEFGHQPKSLLSFGGKTLLQRHLANLAAQGIPHLTICVGYCAEQIDAHVAAAPLAVECVMNDRFRRGSVVSLWTVRDALTCGEEVLLMDADVLYAPRLLTRLVQSQHRNCFLLDEDFIPGDEPVKICVANHQIVEFRKKLDPKIHVDYCGESVGFFKFDPACATALAGVCTAYIEQGRLDEPYEEAIRDLIRAGNHAMGWEKVAGLPWLEIDFPEDLARARSVILPYLDCAHV